MLRTEKCFMRKLRKVRNKNQEKNNENAKSNFQIMEVENFIEKKKINERSNNIINNNIYFLISKMC